MIVGASSQRRNPARTADSEAAPRASDGFVRSFARGLNVIRAFAHTPPNPTLSEVAQHAKMDRAGARRILLTLRSLGYVESDGKHFRLTARVLDLGFAYLSSLPMWHLAQPVIEDLVQDVRESSSAAVLDGTDIVYVLRVPTTKIMSVNLGVGSRLPAWCTSMGRVLLSGLPPDEARARLQASERRPLTTRTVTDLDELEGLVAQARRQGYSIVNQELEDGLVSVAVPIRNRAGEIIAALNIGGQVQRTPVSDIRTRVLPRLQFAAQRISALISARG